MDVLMPQLGETVDEGTVANWYKQEGDEVQADEILLEVETDKVSMEVPAPKAGRLAKIMVAAGETVDVGTVLAIIQADGEPAADEPPTAAAQGSSSGSEPAATPAADPAIVRTAATADTSTADTSAVGASATGASVAGASLASSATADPVARSEQQRLSPAVRRLIAEHNLDIAVIRGTGRNGRITRRNVIEFINAGGASSVEPAPAAPAMAHAATSPQPTPPVPSTAPPTARPQPTGGSGGPLKAETIPFSRIRKLTAEHMVMSKATSPHVLQAVEVDFSGVERVRKAFREFWKSKHGFSLTYLPFIAHSVCKAMLEFPNVNGRVGDNELILHDRVNLAIAVDLGPGGLVAPVVHSADKMSVPELARSINAIAARARDNKLRPDDLAGGTYTISNSGTFGTLITAPIINQPQVAILSTDGVRKKPVVIEHSDGDAIGIRPIGVLAQSFDHRVIDGAYSAAFLDRVRALLERTDWFREV